MVGARQVPCAAPCPAPGRGLLCRVPASSDLDREVGRGAWRWALTAARTHADCPSVTVSLRLCQAGRAALRGRCWGAVGSTAAAYFCIWNRKSRRLMFLAASSLLHSTESTMGSGT